MSTRERLVVDVDLSLDVACQMDYEDLADCPMAGRWKARWDIHCGGGEETKTLCDFHRGALNLPIWKCTACSKDDIRLIDYVTLLERL